MSERLRDARVSAANAVTALTGHLRTLLACSDMIAAQGFNDTACETRYSILRAITALNALHDELTTIEIVEHLIAKRGPPS